jgi:hypothetical protein
MRRRTHLEDTMARTTFPLRCLVLVGALLAAPAAECGDPLHDCSPATQRVAAGLPPAAQDRLRQRIASVPQADRGQLFACPDGHLGIACVHHGTAAAGLAAPPAAAALAMPATPPTPPVLNSRANAPRAIYIDVNGAIITGTPWNSAYGVATWSCLPFDRDGDPATFSRPEQLAIYRIWARIAEDFSPWNVNVTTVPPPATTPSTSVLITPGRDAAGLALPGGPGGGGIAWLGSFGQTVFTPSCFVRIGLEADPAYLAELATHELGHTFGLSHDGTTGSEYYTGHTGTSGATEWGPIMGTAVFRQVSQWSRGEYLGANNTEDDLAIIGAALSLRSDDAGNTFNTPRNITAASGRLSTSGIITSATDRDALRFTVSAGPVTLAVRPFAADINPGFASGSNLDIALDLVTAAGVPVTSADPTGRLDAVIQTTLPAGTYVLIVRGAGEPAPPATGYSNYASIGTWILNGVVPVAAGVDQPPQVATAAAASPAFTTATQVNLSVLGADDAGASTLTYRWSAVGIPSGMVAFNRNNSNAARTAVATIRGGVGRYTLRATITDTADPALPGAHQPGSQCDRDPSGSDRRCHGHGSRSVRHSPHNLPELHLVALRWRFPGRGRHRRPHGHHYRRTAGRRLHPDRGDPGPHGHGRGQHRRAADLRVQGRQLHACQSGRE